MGKLRKIGSKIAGAFRKVGRKLKKGLGKIAKAFGKLGPLGSLAMSFILPGIGGAISNWLTTGPMGSFFTTVFDGVSKAGKFLKDGVGRVFNRVTDAIEVGMNTVSKPFMQEGARGAGSAFRDFVSDVTGGFVEKSTIDLKDDMGNILTDSNPFTKDEFIKDMSPEDLTNLQDRNKFLRDVKKFETRELEGLTKKSTDTGFEYYKTGEDGKLLDKPFKTITDTSSESYLAAAKKKIEEQGDGYSILDGNQEDQSFRKFVSGSKEAGVYKKIAPVSAYGTAIIQNENDIANYNQSVKEQQSDYFSGYAQSFLNSGTNQQFGGSVQQSFVDVSKFQQSNNLTEDWLKTVYGNINIPTDPTQALLLAQQANPYGFQLTDIYNT